MSSIILKQCLPIEVLLVAFKKYLYRGSREFNGDRWSNIESPSQLPKEKFYLQGNYSTRT